MVLDFYYDMVSSGCRAVFFLLKEGGVPFTPKLVELQEGQHLQDEFLKINPYHKIPTIDDGGYVLTESAAIMKYIALQHDMDIHWYPWDVVQKSSKVDEYLHWHHLNIRKNFVTILLELGASRIDNFLGIQKKPANEAVLSAARAELQAAVKNIADYFLRDRLFIAGDEISIADLSGFAELIGLCAVNETYLYEDSPVVAAWMKRVQDKVKNHFAEALKSIHAIQKLYNE